MIILVQHRQISGTSAYASTVGTAGRFLLSGFLQSPQPAVQSLGMATNVHKKHRAVVYHTPVYGPNDLVGDLPVEDSSQAQMLVRDHTQPTVL